MGLTLTFSACSDDDEKRRVKQIPMKIHSKNTKQRLQQLTQKSS